MSKPLSFLQLLKAFFRAISTSTTRKRRGPPAVVYSFPTVGHTRNGKHNRYCSGLLIRSSMDFGVLVQVQSVPPYYFIPRGMVLDYVR